MPLQMCLRRPVDVEPRRVTLSAGPCQSEDHKSTHSYVSLGDRLRPSLRCRGGPRYAKTCPVWRTVVMERMTDVKDVKEHRWRRCSSSW